MVLGGDVLFAIETSSIEPKFRSDPIAQANTCNPLRCNAPSVPSKIVRHYINKKTIYKTHWGALPSMG